MGCTCIKKVYDVHLSYKDCKTLVYEDQSDWMSGEAYEYRPSTQVVEVYIPSKKKEYVINIDPSKRNYITSVELFGTSEPVCLPDDIYCFKTFSCGEYYQINRALTCRAECKIDELVSKAKTKEDYSEILFLRNMIQSVKVNASLGKSESAMEILQIVNKKLKHLTCANC